jgi:transposase
LNKDAFFDNFNFSLDDVYDALTHFDKISGALQQHLHEQVTKQYARETDLAYYDVTNYYFEIDEQDELRRKGVSKEHRPDPIVQMGLFMDSEGIPISYNLFPGNTNDCETLIPQTKDLRRDFGIGRVIVVADKGLNTARNCYFNTHNLKNGYVFSQSVRGGHKELKDYVLEQSGYQVNKEGFKIKSRIYPREIELERADGGKFKTRIDEKQVIFYSPDYDRKAKTDRAATVAKARQMANTLSQQCTTRLTPYILPIFCVVGLALR